MIVPRTAFRSGLRDGARFTVCAFSLFGAFVSPTPSQAHAQPQALMQALAHARVWTRLTVPGASCGNGSPYSIYFRAGDPTKIAFEFMGGGACWNQATCYGPTPLTPMFPLPTVVPSDGIASSDPSRSPVADHTYVHFPYCTGDVHAGTHTAVYGRGAQARHHGSLNVAAGIAALEGSGLVDFPNLRSAVVYGASAGAIGALFHARSLESLIPADARKALIVDSPGLHFGTTFWSKFPAPWRNDVLGRLKMLGVKLGPTDGNVAAFVPRICAALSNWRIGFLQGSRDVVMSAVFGETSADAHEARVYGPYGLLAATSASADDNCSSWIHRSASHTFVLFPTTRFFTAGGVTAFDFAKDLVEGRDGADAYDLPPR